MLNRFGGLARSLLDRMLPVVAVCPKTVKRPGEPAVDTGGRHRRQRQAVAQSDLKPRKNRASQAGPPAPPKQILCLQLVRQAVPPTEPVDGSFLTPSTSGGRSGLGPVLGSDLPDGDLTGSMLPPAPNRSFLS